MGKFMRVGIGFATLALLSACASRPAITSSTQGTTLVQSGEVTAIRDRSVRGGRNSGIGSFVGAIIGGVAGSSIGSGTGQVVAGLGGAMAGSMAGQHVEQSAPASSSTELTVRLDSGELRSFEVPSSESFRVGDIVKLTTSQGTTRITH